MDRITGEDISVEEWSAGELETRGKVQARGFVRARTTSPAANTEAMESP